MSSILASVARAAFRRVEPALLGMANSLERFITRPRPEGDIVDVAAKNFNAFLFSNAVLTLYYFPSINRDTRKEFERVKAMFPIDADADEE